MKCRLCEKKSASSASARAPKLLAPCWVLGCSDKTLAVANLKSKDMATRGKSASLVRRWTTGKSSMTGGWWKGDARSKFQWPFCTVGASALEWSASSWYHSHCKGVWLWPSKESVFMYCWRSKLKHWVSWACAQTVSAASFQGWPWWLWIWPHCTWQLNADSSQARSDRLTWTRSRLWMGVQHPEDDWPAVKLSNHKQQGIWEKEQRNLRSMIQAIAMVMAWSSVRWDVSSLGQSDTRKPPHWRPWEVSTSRTALAVFMLFLSAEPSV